MSTTPQRKSTWPIGLTTITIASEHAGLQPHWKRVETALYMLTDRNKENPQALRDKLRELAFRIREM